MANNQVWVVVSNGPEGALVVGVRESRDTAVRLAVAEVEAYLGDEDVTGETAQQLTDEGEVTTEDGSLTVSVQGDQVR